jgi:hypothetical protein
MTSITITPANPSIIVGSQQQLRRAQRLLAGNRFQ